MKVINRFARAIAAALTCSAMLAFFAALCFGLAGLAVSTHAVVADQMHEKLLVEEYQAKCYTCAWASPRYAGRFTAEMARDGHLAYHANRGHDCRVITVGGDASNAACEAEQVGSPIGAASGVYWQRAKVMSDQRTYIWAPPQWWSPETVVGSCFGQQTLKIEIEYINSKASPVEGEVIYIGEDGRQRRESFMQTTTICTGDVIATVKVRVRSLGMLGQPVNIIVR